MRIALRFAYDGRFAGYARQPEGDTVEDHLIDALRREGFQDGSWVTGSRTDKGVCAVANVAAIEIDRPHLQGFLPAVQKHLPDGIWVTGVAPVDADWTPRHAVSRTYEYVMPDLGQDVPAMEAACRAFLGSHDMSGFARVDGRDPIRRVDAFAVELDEDILRWTVRGPNFLWNQVRRMVSAVHTVGQGRATVQDIVEVLEGAQPQGRFKRLPPEGLLLYDVAYDPPLPWAPEAGPLGGDRWARARQTFAVMQTWSAQLSGLMRD